MGILVAEHFYRKSCLKMTKRKVIKMNKSCVKMMKGNFRHNRTHLRKLPGEQRRRFCLQKRNKTLFMVIHTNY